MTIRFNIPLFLTLTTTIVLLSYCSSLADSSDNTDYPITDQQHLTYTLSQIQDSLSVDKEGVEYLSTFYKDRNYKTIWVKDSSLNNLSFLEYVNDEVLLNLPFKTLTTRPFSNSNTPYQKELIAVLRLSEFLDIQKKGIINFKDSSINTHTYIKQKQLDRFIKSKNKNIAWVSHLLSFDIKNHKIPTLHRTLNEFTSKHPVNEEVITVKIEDSIGSASNKVALNLMRKGFIKDTSIIKDSLIKVFKDFQYINGLKPDGVLGKNSLRALNESNLKRFYKGIIALEKLKSIPDSLISSKYIEVNIPSFILHFYNEDTIVSRHRVVAGANLTQTPEFEASLKYIVVNPYWHVPYSIASTEILYGARKDSNYFSKRKYILTKKGDVVSPDSVNWQKISTRSFPFNVKQASGPSNSLGLLKVLFPNKHAVYIHDTPAKHLFNREERNFSHGCIRVEDPFQLAKNILSLEDHVYTDSLDTLVKRGQETYLNINDPFLVHIRYRTAIVDDSTDQVLFFNDIYKREEKYMRLFEQSLP